MKVWENIFLFKQMIFRFHVDFPRSQQTTAAFRTTATTMTFCLSSPTAAVSPEGSLLSAEKKMAAREAQGGKMICRGT